MLARTTLGFSGSTVPGRSTTAEAPAASAVRIIVPRFPGSCTRSTISSRRSSRTSRGSSAAGGGGAAPAGQRGQPRVLRIRGDQQVLDRRRRAQRFLHEAHAVDEKTPGLLAVTALVQLAQTLDQRVLG